MEEAKAAQRTRERILDLLWRGDCTVDELARRVGLTGNAVRAQLSALEGEGLVRKTGYRPGRRKPSVLYGSTTAAERLLPKPYGRALSAVVEELSSTLGDEATASVLKQAGERMGAEQQARFAGLAEDASAAELSNLLGDLGGVGEVEKTGEGEYLVRGYSCPLRSVVDHRPEACEVMHGLISTALGGAEVRQRCRHNGKSECRFEVDFRPGRDQRSD